MVMSQFKACGIKVSDNGVISEGAFDYGVMRLDGIIDVNGNLHKFDDYKNMEFNEREHVVTFHLDEEESFRLVGGSLNDSLVSEDIVIREIPTTTARLDSVFPELFPDWKSQLYYDELMERDIMDLSMLGLPPKEVPIDEKIVALYHKKVEERLAECGFFGKRMVSKDTMDEVLMIRLYGNNRNRFRERVESIQWDGVQRLSSYFQDAFGATAPSLDKEEENEYLAGIAEAWFVGGISRMYGPTQLDVVPVLIGAQGAGKTRGLKYTAMEDQWYGSTAVDISAPGGVESFLDAARGKIVVEMGEATQLRSKDSEKLKQFISQDIDSMRKKYEKHNSDYPRHFILAATTNIENLFTDVTGNRRYFPFKCDPHLQALVWSVNDRSEGNRYIEQVWAEALYRYRRGATPNVSKRVMALAKKQQDFNTQENPSISLIDRWLDDPANEHTEIGDFITKDMVMEGLFGYNSDSYLKEPEQMWKAWCTGQKSWERVKPRRVNNKTVRGYVRRLRPGQEPEALSFNMVDSADDPAIVEIRMQALFRKLNRLHEFYECGPFPYEEVSQEELSFFQEKGYVYNQGTMNKPDWRVGYIV